MFRIPDVPRPIQFRDILQAAQNIKQQRLANERARQLLPFAAPTAQADIALKQAQAQKAIQEARDPFAAKAGTLDKIPTQRLYAQHVIETYGINSPQAVNAVSDLHRMIEEQRALVSYRDALTKSMPARALTGTSKSLVEQARVVSGHSPTGETWQQVVGGPQSLEGEVPAAATMSGQTPEQVSAGIERGRQIVQQSKPGETIDTAFGVLPKAPGPIAPIAGDAAAQLALKRNKDVTDEDARKRVRFSTNVDKSFQILNEAAPEALQYSKPSGVVDLGKDRVASMLGHTPERYQKYIDFKRTLGFLKEQLVQFYGMSKQPEKAVEIEKLLNSISFHSNPKQAADTLRNVEKIYQRERNTYVQAATDADFYRKNRADLTKDLDSQIANPTFVGQASATAREATPDELLRIARGGK